MLSNLNNTKRKREPFMPKGTKIYWKGDLICESLIDGYSGDPMVIDGFAWYTDKPQPGDQIHPAIALWCAYREKQIRERNINVIEVK